MISGHGSPAASLLKSGGSTQDDRSGRILVELRATLPLSDWGRVADQTSPMRDLGANVAPRPERRAGSQTIKVGEVGENPVTGERSGSLERRWDNPASRVTGELTALVGARVLREHRHPALVEQFTVLEGALSILRFGGREGIRTPGLLIANTGENKLRQGATIT